MSDWNASNHVRPEKCLEGLSQRFTDRILHYRDIDIRLIPRSPSPARLGSVLLYLFCLVVRQAERVRLVAAPS